MQDPSPQALLAWLEKHRLPHFCKSSLCLHLILCQKLLGFIRSGEAAKLLNWQSRDQWLLEKCISGSQGMWHFRAFLQGMAGEELTNFWLTTEMLLGLDESDEKQRELYLSLLHRLQATHLREGSSVSTLCRTIIGSLPKARHVQPISTRREILSKMQEQVLFMIQNYWLPKFFIHCKVCMEKEKSCQPLLQEYQECLLGGNSQKPSGFSEQLFTMHIKRSQGLSGPYCSKKAKAEVWTLIKGRKDTQEMKIPSFQVHPGSTKESHLNKDALGLIPQGSEHPANTAFKGKREATSPKRSKLIAKKVINPEDFCEEKILSNLHSSAPLVQLPSLKKPGKTLSLLPWALSAETCAGRPFRDFLKHQGWSVETQLLDLWHDLEEFLPLVLDPSRENSFFLRHLIGEKICKTYLDDGTSEQLPLEPRTLQSLREHLMSGEFSPWISRAQKEICKVLCCFYEEFLAADDRTFLQYMAKETHRGHEHLHGSPQSEVPMPTMQGHAVKKDEGFLLSQRLNESLQLSQALHGTRNLESLSSEHWQLIATQDLQKGSFIQAGVEILLHKKDSQKKMTKVFAVDHPSNEDELPCQKSSSLAVEPKKTQKRTLPVREKSCITTGEVEKPTRRPRTFVKLLHNPGHLQYFKKFLEERKADKPLCFWMAVEKLATETNPKTKSCLLNCIVRNYFHAEIPAEEQLDSHSSIIREISEAGEVSSSMLMTAQVFVQKAMEKRWFKEYQNLFPPSDTHKPNLRLRHRVRNVKTDKLRWAWYAIRHLVRSLCRFRKEMKNDKSRRDFEAFLRLELQNEDENMPINSMQSTSTTSHLHSHTAPASTALEKELVLVKRQMFGSQVITVNFLVDDLHFYLEIEKFSRLADSAEDLAAHNVQPEKEVAFLRKKVAIISKLFLNSDLPPKLRVNIPEEERDLIWSLSSKGILNRSLYHRAKVILFPILMHFWKRFCTWRVMRSFLVPTKDNISPVPSDSTKTFSKSSDIYSPGNHAIIAFTLQKGIQTLLPQPQKKMEPQWEQKDSNKSLEKRLSSRKSVSCQEQTPKEGGILPRKSRSSNTTHAEQVRGIAPRKISSSVTEQ